MYCEMFSLVRSHGVVEQHKHKDDESNEVDHVLAAALVHHDTEFLHGAAQQAFGAVHVFSLQKLQSRRHQICEYI